MKISVQRRVPNGKSNLSDSLHPLLKRIYTSREILSDDELSLQMSRLHSPGLLKGIDEAVELLYQHLLKQKRILIVSDFDADGATSCALSLSALTALGFEHVDYIVPNRFEYGYGLTPEIVHLAQQKSPDLIVTVDNGISSIEGVAAANEAGIQVLITDHHLPGEITPEAAAIVNPNQHGCTFPSKSLAGVGVVFYLLLALRAHLRQVNWFAEKQIVEPNMASFLDLVALGTVADVVPLDQNNRILINEGIRRIRAGKACAGILALLDIGRRKKETVVATDLGFVVGPRLNAAGRLDDMSLGIECLLTKNNDVAWQLARQLDGLNKDRKSIESEMKEQALKNLSDIHFNDTEIPRGICIYDDSWHQGVIGILASRIKDKMHRPVIAFADGGEGDDGEEQIKGSARSIQGLHIRDALDAIATKNPGLISKFGGHAMAAGLSMRKRDYQIFRAAFVAEMDLKLTEDALKALILTDGELAGEEISLPVAQILRDAGPWGQNFPEPSFEGVFTIVQQRLVGEKHLKLVLCLGEDSSRILDAIAFNVDLQQWPNNAEFVFIVYKLDINEFRGNRNLQLMIEHLEVRERG